MHLHAAGWANLEQGKSIDPNRTLFRIASVSKPITATVLARLVEDGRIALDSPLEQYVPEYPHTGITLRQLAAHTAGLRTYRGKEFALNRPYTMLDSLEVFKEDPLLFLPGTGYQYNSFDFVLLALAMERATGTPFETLARDLVFTPLGMTQTSAEDPGIPAEFQALPYTKRSRGFRPAVPVDNRYKLAGGGFISTVPDLLSFGQALLHRNLVSQDILKEFITAVEIDGQSTWYGLGWEVSQDPAGRSYFGHTGNSVGVYSIFRIYPEQAKTVALLVNASVPALHPELERLLDALLSPVS
jgi:CubicO group peptidase (beta-lactamase class C family)